MNTENQLQIIQEQVNAEFRGIVPRLMSFMDKETIIKEINFAMQLFNKNKTLAECTPESKQQAILNVAQIGLTLNPSLKLAYLVPRWNPAKQKNECFLEPSYQGLAKLVTDTGSAKYIVSYPVYKGDFFKVELGNKMMVIHHPEFMGNLELTHVYSIATLHDGSQIPEVMSADMVNAIRDNSESYKAFKDGKIRSAVWETHYSEMARKTVLKRLCKYLPKTEMWDKLATAIDLDNSDYPASGDQVSFIESLLNHANITPEMSDRIYSEIKGSISQSRASELIDFLQENQVDAITAGHGYGQREISAKMRQEIPAPETEPNDNNEENLS